MPEVEHPRVAHDPPPPAVRPVSRWRTAWPVTVSWLLTAVLVPLVGYGLFGGDAYRGYPERTVLASRAGDVFTLAVLPVLVLAGIGSRRQSLRAHLLWLGLLFYLAYSYGLYLIGWQQNRAFVGYAVVVTLACASLLDGLARIDVGAAAPAFRNLRTRVLGWFFVVIGIAFTGLWLTDVLPMTFGGRLPTTLGVGGAPYAVYVLDLTVALPTVVVTGIMLVRRHPAAPAIGGVVLVKILTLFTALWLGTAAAALDGLSVPFTADMVPSALLLLGGLWLLVHHARRLAPPRQGWLRRELWRA